MKIISFNLDICKTGDGLGDYLKVFDDHEILLFQEFNSLYLDKFQEIFANFKLFYSPSFIYENSSNNYSTGLLTCIKNTVSLIKQENKFIYGDGIASSFKPNIDQFSNVIGDPRNIQLSLISYINKNILILNYHGISYPSNKKDTEQRLEQSETIVELIINQSYDLAILGGDLNIDIETESLEILETVFTQNLIKKFNIQTTRPKGIYPQFSDYFLATNNAKIDYLKCVNTNLSDHFLLEIKLDL